MPRKSQGNSTGSIRRGWLWAAKIRGPGTSLECWGLRTGHPRDAQEEMQLRLWE